MKKTISLIYGYSARNAGDFAITLGAIDILLSNGFKVKLFSRYSTSNEDYWTSKKSLERLYGDIIEYFECPFSLDRSDSIWSTIRSYLDGGMALIGIKRNDEFRNKLLSSDAIIFNGGNLFHCSSFTDYARLKALLYPLNIARDKKPIVIFPQSASTINKTGQRLLFPILKKSKCVFLRESDSFKYLSSKIPNNNFQQTIDLAFHINKEQLVNVTRNNTIAITLRFHTLGDLKYLPDEQIEIISDYIDSYIDKYKDKYSFIIVVQTDKDEEKSRIFAKKHGLDVFKSNDPIELLQLYKSVKLLIGMRLHSIILALSVGTPCFGLFYRQWGLKNPGLMKDFNMPYRIIDDNTKEDNIKNIDGLLNSWEENSDNIISKVEYEKIKMNDKIAGLFNN